MALSEERRASLLAYCKLTEFADDMETMTTVDGLYEAAVGYMTQAGVAEPPEGTARRAQYDLCVNYLVLSVFDLRSASIIGTELVENPAFRYALNQLKFTEAAVSDSDTAP